MLTLIVIGVKVEGLVISSENCHVLSSGFELVEMVDDRRCTKVWH